MVGSDGTTIASRRLYDPWGKATETGSGALADFGFTGHYFDRPTGESLTWYRGYDPNLGRWLSKDPIGLRGGPNLYAYVKNAPVNLIDPTGEFGLPPSVCPWACFGWFATCIALGISYDLCELGLSVCLEDCYRRDPGPNSCSR